MHPHALRTALVAWPTYGDICLDIRFEVFVEEQGVPAEIEADARDADAVHALCWADDMPVGTGRLLPEGKIGRMAVRAGFRHRGVGAALLKELLDAARGQGLSEVHLAAQAYVCGFYRALGFAPTGPEFMEAGIVHLPMRRRL